MIFENSTPRRSELQSALDRDRSRGSTPETSGAEQPAAQAEARKPLFASTTAKERRLFDFGLSGKRAGK